MYVSYPGLPVKVMTTLTFVKGGKDSGHHGHSGLAGVHGGSTPSGKEKAETKKPEKTKPKSGFQKDNFSPGETRDARRAKGIYDVISETDVESAKILLTQGVEPSFKPQIQEVTEYAPGRGAEREGLYVANQEAFSRGSFGKVRLYMTTKKDGLRSPLEMSQLGRKDVDDVLASENGAVTSKVLSKNTFVAVELRQNGKWVTMSPSQFLKSVGVSSNTPKLPTVPTYKKWLTSNAGSFHLSIDQVDEIAHDYNRATLEDKLWMAEEAGLL